MMRKPLLPQEGFFLLGHRLYGIPSLHVKEVDSSLLSPFLFTFFYQVLSFVRLVDLPLRSFGLFLPLCFLLRCCCDGLLFKKKDLVF